MRTVTINRDDWSGKTAEITIDAVAPETYRVTFREGETPLTVSLLRDEDGGRYGRVEWGGSEFCKLYEVSTASDAGEVWYAEALDISREHADPCVAVARLAFMLV